MDPRAEFETFLRFLHDNGVGLQGPGWMGSYEQGGYEERRLADAYELHARTAASSRNGASRPDHASPAASAPTQPGGAA